MCGKRLREFVFMFYVIIIDSRVVRTAKIVHRTEDEEY